MAKEFGHISSQALFGVGTQSGDAQQVGDAQPTSSPTIDAKVTA